MTEAQYTQHASLQCETHPERLFFSAIFSPAPARHVHIWQRETKDPVRSDGGYAVLNLRALSDSG